MQINNLMAAKKRRVTATKSKSDVKYTERTITPDYIIDLYRDSFSVPDARDRDLLVEDIKKLVQYLGKQVTLKIE